MGCLRSPSWVVTLMAVLYVFICFCVASDENGKEISSRDYPQRVLELKLADEGAILIFQLNVFELSDATG